MYSECMRMHGHEKDTVATVMAMPGLDTVPEVERAGNSGAVTKA